MGIRSRIAREHGKDLNVYLVGDSSHSDVIPVLQIVLIAFLYIVIELQMRLLLVEWLI